MILKKHTISYLGCHHDSRDRLFDELGIASTNNFSTTVHMFRAGYMTRRGKVCAPRQRIKRQLLLLVSMVKSAVVCSFSVVNSCNRLQLSLRHFWTRIGKVISTRRLSFSGSGLESRTRVVQSVIVVSVKRLSLKARHGSIKLLKAKLLLFLQPKHRAHNSNYA